jgi:hypothetical protein
MLVSVTRFIKKDTASRPANIDNFASRVLVTPQKRFKNPKETLY